MYTWRTICSSVRPPLPARRQQLPADPGDDVVEVRPGRPEERQAPLELGRRQHLVLDQRRHVGDAPEVGRARPGHPLDDLDLRGMGELAPEAGPLGDARVAGAVRRQPLDRGLLVRAPPVEAGPVHRTRDDPSLLADLQDHAASRPPCRVAYPDVRIFQNESFFTIVPSRNVHRSQPRTSIRSPSVVVPDSVHSDAPRSPSTKCESSR